MKMNQIFKTVIGAIAMTAILGAPIVGAGETPNEMVLVPGGPFVMGVDKAINPNVKNMSKMKQLKYAVSREAFNDEGPARTVTLNPFHLDKFEVSNKKYRAFIKATGHPAPAYWDDHRRNKMEQPVSGVNWNDANAFCHWANKRLPTEAEWEKTARGPESFKYPWGNDLDPTKGNFARKQEYTSNVNAYPEGKSPYGAYNMAGNVFEWVADWYDPNYYKNTQENVNPIGPRDGAWLSGTGTYVDRIAVGKKRVIRGGSWYAPASSVTNTHRFWNDPMNNSYGVGLGFRCARSIDSDPTMQARTFYMDALINMGAEKYQPAMNAIDKALEQDGTNAEYLEVKEMIQKQIN